MAFKNFSEELYIKVQNTNETIDLGKIESSSEFSLTAIRLQFFMHNVSAASGNETIQLKLFTNPGLTKVYASSDILTVSDFVTGSTDWIGNIGFQFLTKPNINSFQNAYAGIVATNYTRNANSFYMGYVYDWPFPRRGETEDFPISIEVFGKQHGV
jgi:hypothetical protein